MQSFKFVARVNFDSYDRSNDTLVFVRNHEHLRNIAKLSILVRSIAWNLWSIDYDRYFLIGMITTSSSQFNLEGRQ